MHKIRKSWSKILLLMEQRRKMIYLPQSVALALHHPELWFAVGSPLSTVAWFWCQLFCEKLTFWGNLTQLWLELMQPLSEIEKSVIQQYLHHLHRQFLMFMSSHCNNPLTTMNESELLFLLFFHFFPVVSSHGSHHLPFLGQRSFGAPQSLQGTRGFLFCREEREKRKKKNTSNPTLQVTIWPPYDYFTARCK